MMHLIGWHNTLNTASCGPHLWPRFKDRLEDILKDLRLPHVCLHGVVYPVKYEGASVSIDTDNPLCLSAELPAHARIIGD